MVSEVLSYLIMITCILIRVSSKEVEWTVRDTPPKLGQDLTLFCKVDNCTETKRWHGGPDKKPLMSSSGLSTDKTKYSTSIEKNGFILNILNPTIKDLNINYTCSCGLDLDNHILYIEDVYTADNLNKTTNGTFFSADNLNKTTNGTNYIGTNDVGGISLYVYIAIPVILVILLIIVIVKRHWLWGRLKEKIYGTGRRNTATGSLEPSASWNGSERVDNPNVTVPLLDSNPGQSSGSTLPTDHVYSNQRQISDIEEESPMYVGEDNLNFNSKLQELLRLNTLKDEELIRERKRIEEQLRNLQTKCEELLRLNTLKDEELKTERKQNGEQIRNLQTKCGELLRLNTLKDEKFKAETKKTEEQLRNLQTKYEELLRSNTLKDEELKTETKQNEEQLTNLQTKYEELLGIQDEALKKLRKEMKQNEEEHSVTSERFLAQIKILQAKYDEECKKLKKAVGELERENERVEEEARDEYKEGNEMVKPQMEITEKVKREKAKLEEGSSLPSPHIEIKQRQGSGSSLPSTHIEINRRQGSGEINSLRGNAH